MIITKRDMGDVRVESYVDAKGAQRVTLLKVVLDASVDDLVSPSAAASDKGKR